MSPKVDEASFRTISFDQVYEAYAEQIRGLRDGGVDLLLIETIFDTLNAKAAIAAAMDVAPDLPRWLSVTIVDRSGRTLSGQTLEAFWASIEHAEPMIAGVNCSLGATEMRPYVEALARVAPIPVSCYPNAGLPNAFGGYDETPETTSGLLGEFAGAGLVNIVGGCCGTTPEHIRMIADTVHDVARREVPRFDDRYTTLSGLEPFRITPETGFVMVGERTNITGSAKFRRLIESGDFQSGGRRRARAGAQRRQRDRREHGRRPARLREGDDDVPEPRRDRARDRARADHDRQLEVVGDRGGTEVRAGPRHRELDQPEGGRGGLPRRRPGGSSATAPRSS